MVKEAVPWVDRMRGHRVVVVGDPVLDVYLNGFSDRVSREAPVLIVHEESRDARLGGAANTAANLASLGAEVTLVGFIGRDPEADQLSELVARSQIKSALVQRSMGCTITKTRVMAGGLNIRKQQMLRIDRENREPPTLRGLDRLRSAVRSALPNADALVISDYGDPTLTDLYVTMAENARAEGRTVVVDSRHALMRFEGVTAVTPNEPEVESILGHRLTSDQQTLEAAKTLYERLAVEAMVITRGRKGMAVVGKDEPGTLIPAVGGDAVDVTGAGDTVTAAFTLALLAEAPVLVAAKLASHAAAVTVQQVGAAVCTPEQLAASWDEA